MTDWLARAEPAAAAWTMQLWNASWQGGLALALAWLTGRALPRMNPSVRCWIWRLAYARLLLGLVWLPAIPVAVLPASGGHGSEFSVQALNSNSNSNSNRARARGEPPRASSLSSTPTPNAQRRVPSGWPNALPLLALWLAGAGCVLLRTVRAAGRTRRMLRACTPVVAPPLRVSAAELAAQLGLPCVPTLAVSDEVTTPLLSGLRRRVVVLPRGLIEDSIPDDTRLVLAHELAHLRRGDLHWSWLPAAAGVLFFFHPLVWLGRREWALAQEIACDELTLQASGAKPAEYADVLVSVASRRGARPAHGLLAVGATASFSLLERRLSAMTRFCPVSRRRKVWGAGALVLLAAAVLLPWRVVAQPESGAPATPGPAVGQPAVRVPVAAPRNAPTGPGSVAPPARVRRPATQKVVPPPVRPNEQVLAAQQEAARAQLALAEARARDARERAAAGIAGVEAVTAAEAELARARAQVAQANAASRGDAAAAAEARVAKREAARAALAAAEHRVALTRERVRAGLAVPTEQLEAEAAAAAARAALEVERAGADAEGAGKAGIGAARAGAAAAEGEFKRIQELVAKGFVSRAELDQAAARLAQAGAALAAAEAAARAGRDSPGGNSRRTADLYAARADAVRAEAAVTAARAAAEAALRKAKADLARAQAQLAVAQTTAAERSQRDRIRKQLANVNARLGAKPAGAAPAARPSRVPRELGEARLRAARTRYELGLRHLQGADTASSMEDLYLWSRRWLDAERALNARRAGEIAAHTAHVARMKDLERMARARFEAGVGTLADVSASEYYRTEAELGLAQARGR